LFGKIKELSFRNGAHGGQFKILVDLPLGTDFQFLYFVAAAERTTKYAIVKIVFFKG